MPDDKTHEKKDNFLYFHSRRKKTSTEIRAKCGANLCTIEGSRWKVQRFVARLSHFGLIFLARIGGQTLTQKNTLFACLLERLFQLRYQIRHLRQHISWISHILTKNTIFTLTKKCIPEFFWKIRNSRKILEKTGS